MKRISNIIEQAKSGEKITALTAYDASFARLLESCGIDIILVGDSLGMVVQGHSNTLSVTLEEMIYHTRIVASNCTEPLIMADLPFGTYGTKEQTLMSAQALIKAGAAVVKIEGSEWLAKHIELLTQCGIPVCAHIGLNSQYIHTMGGFKIQGRSVDGINELTTTAKNLQDAGASLLVLECVSLAAAQQVLEVVNIPVIGIGAGSNTDGQILVTYDMLGLTPGKPYKFVKNFMQETGNITEAIKAYVKAVKNQTFPSQEHCY